MKHVNDMRRQSGNKLAGTVRTREIDGTQLTLEISPCSWMYPNYGLQVKITMAGGGDCFFHEKDKLFADANEDDLNKLFDQVRLVKCSRCGKPAFDPMVCGTNRDGLCESCFIDDLNKEFQKVHEKERQKLAKLDAKRKAEGFTHRVSAWIHPSQGGDDYQVEIWFKRDPPQKEITDFLRKKKSSVLDDYQVLTL